MRNLISCVLLLIGNVLLVSADCTSPEIPNLVYALTKTSSLFSTGAVFDIVCKPGFGSSTVVHLRCNADGTWRGNSPDCSKEENTAKWWIFLLGMVGVVVLVPCIFPRLYFTFIDTSPPRKYWSNQKREKINHPGRDRIRMQPLSCEPKESGGQSQLHHGDSLTPLPLPPIRRQKDQTNNDRYIVA